MSLDYKLDKLKLKSHLGHVLRGAELKSALDCVLQLVGQLESVISRLSYVKEDNIAESSYAEKLRLEKRRLQIELAFWLQELIRYLVYLNKEVLRCKRNLKRIRADAEKIKLEQVRERYSRAEREQETQYRLAVQDRNAVHNVLEKVKAVLEVSETGQFPGASLGMQSFLTT